MAKFERAIEMTRVALNEDPGDLKQLGLLIEFHAMIGDRPATLGLIAAADSLGGNDPGLLYRIGDAYELVGDREAALRYLGEAMRHGVPVERIQNTRELAHLVQDPRFVRMVSAASGTEDSQADSLQ